VSCDAIAQKPVRKIQVREVGLGKVQSLDRVAQHPPYTVRMMSTQPYSSPEYEDWMAGQYNSEAPNRTRRQV